MLVVLALAVAGIVAITKVGINLNHRPRNPTGIRRGEGEYQAPEPPDGRYLG